MQSFSIMYLGVAVALVCSVLTEGRSLPKGSVDDNRIANFFKRRWIHVGPTKSIDSVEDNRVANLLRREANGLLAVKSKRNDGYPAPTPSWLRGRFGRATGRSASKDSVEDNRMAKFSWRRTIELRKKKCLKKITNNTNIIT
ncbi:unnamed protein product [Owenia fusiformis]|uniref:Uncharacterized protein n=1 Tax=Owenia fusiformis TaxID=6347 RepID=A0A8J1Y344_OWEFU|nr:unnamed protein product [Owenia fusiformis]